MKRLSLLSPADIQQQLAEAIRQKRKAMKLSREALAEKSTVPAPTIKKFETTGQVSLRQFILLWQCVDDLERLAELYRVQPIKPQSIDEVLGK
ncbi:helix-turn-helix domain-containing protein [Spartinivicinus poritis]|uniref:Helix-turn-helix transcriptional regulator n=1 Tax=Spartinivicinus poritis TaxID=2994640 RepID=A0ABT5UGZ7_9GAMM|nr:helix-turn-helix transcriptional regulator [Spartinivicinus sp. A2-2]MDE1465271.1 helix-turn-helix transcriptional regulator [Spartinivicinus sp. A2-2]